MSFGIKQNRLLRIIIIFLVSAHILHKGLAAHPHVFIVQRIKVIFDDNGLSGFKIRWDFDDMFTSMIAGDYDKNQNGLLEPDEVSVIKEEAFSYTSNQDYFTFIKIDGKPFKVRYVKDFSAQLNDNKLVYEFFIPCHVRAASSMKQVIVASYDPTYYSAIYYADKNPASLEKGEKFRVKSAIRQDASTSIYFGMVHPWALFLNFSLKP